MRIAMLNNPSNWPVASVPDGALGVWSVIYEGTPAECRKAAGEHVWVRIRKDSKDVAIGRALKARHTELTA